MGWGTGDQLTVEDAKIQVSFARQQFYKLKKVVEQINHQEKREAMVKLCDEAYEKLDRIDFHLNR